MFILKPEIQKLILKDDMICAKIALETGVRSASVKMAILRGSPVLTQKYYEEAICKVTGLVEIYDKIEVQTHLHE